MSEHPQTDSPYDDHDRIAAGVADGEHRSLIGGLWEEIGALQLAFLRSHGLTPKDRLIDIGCGSLRGGVRFVDYLEPGRYWGIDANRALLDAGYEIELGGAGLQPKAPRDQLLCNDEFDFHGAPAEFDYALAQSLFTHLSANRIRLCLERTAGIVRPGGRLFATFFVAPDDHPIGRSLAHPHGVTTWAYKNPFHYRLSDIETLLVGLPWRLAWFGDWGHPRDQTMVILERLPDASGLEAAPDDAIRALTTSEAGALKAGDTHYRAYVGPPNRYDFMSATQFALLFALGLRDRHSVLDFGCGSLRLGRLLIPFLHAGGYYGIDPNRWLIEDALSRELGWSIVPLKAPHFAYNDDFRCDVFDRRFDFIVAQSILTHCGRDLARSLIGEMAAALEPHGIALFSIIQAPPDGAETEEEGWIYPHCVAFREDTIGRWCAEFGMTALRLPWHHPGAVWYAAALDAERLPKPHELALLSGSVLFDPQFAASRPAGPG